MNDSEGDSIKVVIRVRPLFSGETNEQIEWIAYDGRFMQRVNGNEIYEFDRVFDSLSNTKDIYREYVQSIIDSAINGYNGTILAYGQTASGKTHTIFGSCSEDGIIQMAIRSIFDAIASRSTSRYLLRISFIELYNEKVRDLLVDNSKDLSVKEIKEQTVIQGIKEEVITSDTSADYLIRMAYDRRVVGETTSNQRSSRSHVIIRLIIESHDALLGESSVSYISHLNIVDLAGSENSNCVSCQKERIVEGASINRSLLALLRVIQQLSDKCDHISFRDSKLTRLLKSSLGGNARTIIICSVSPLVNTETLQTLRFASRAKIIKNRPVQNKTSDDALLSRYLRMIEDLKAQLKENQRIEKNERDVANYKENLIKLKGCILYGSNFSGYQNRRKTWGGGRFICPSEFSLKENTLKEDANEASYNLSVYPSVDGGSMNSIEEFQKNCEENENASVLDYSIIGFSTCHQEIDDTLSEENRFHNRTSSTQTSTISITVSTEIEADLFSMVEKSCQCPEDNPDLPLYNDRQSFEERFKISESKNMELMNIIAAHEKKIENYLAILKVGKAKYGKIKVENYEKNALIRELEERIAILQKENDHILNYQRELLSSKVTLESIVDDGKKEIINLKTIIDKKNKDEISKNIEIEKYRIEKNEVEKKKLIFLIECNLGQRKTSLPTNPLSEIMPLDVFSPPGQSSPNLTPLSYFKKVKFK
ncbi:unnamed protein product [Dracunculus medinensis]|uniref:Kinesin-like protein n=1 Tax=Dracunculus medinensis TaxID=318479 RepID=A0A0N4UJM7_DRAME|nr:unnamed protein product [Dracunculus medinensis]